MNPTSLIATTLLLSALCALALCESSFGADECCFEYYPRILQKDRVVNYERTHPLCSKDGIIFVMKNGVEICANPDQKWVRYLMRRVDSLKPRVPVEQEGSGPHDNSS